MAVSRSDRMLHRSYSIPNHPVDDSSQAEGEASCACGIQPFWLGHPCLVCWQLGGRRQWAEVFGGDDDGLAGVWVGGLPAEHPSGLVAGPQNSVVSKINRRLLIGSTVQ